MVIGVISFVICLRPKELGLHQGVLSPNPRNFPAGYFWGRIRIRIAKYAKPVLNNGEARNALARALLFNRLRGIRTVISSSSDTGLPHNLVMAAVVLLWSAVYLERTTNALRGHGQAVNKALLESLSPLGWEHINLRAFTLAQQRPGSMQANSSRYDHCNRLGVLCDPNSDATPKGVRRCAAL